MLMDPLAFIILGRSEENNKEPVTIAIVSAEIRSKDL
jgi:hypothetical protein